MTPTDARLRRATLAVPFDITTRTGGTIYDRRLLECLRAQGRDMDLITLPGGFPAPGPDAMAQALALLASVPAHRALIIDGLAYGALEAGLPKADGLAYDGFTGSELQSNLLNAGGQFGIGAPVVALVHHPLALESGLPASEQDRLMRTERANLRHAAAVLVPSPHTRALLIDRYAVAPDRITIALPGTDRPQPAAGMRKSNPPLILSVGLLHPRKGHDVLIAALAQITDLNWQARIAGPVWDTDHAAALARQIDAAGLGGRVVLAGEVSAETLSQSYHAASVFALATRFEGYGMVFNEALAHGLPIVSCRTGAVPDTVPPDAGLLVPPDDAVAFAAALRLLLADPARLAQIAAASARAGAVLAPWSDTARIVGEVLDALP